LGYIYSSTSVVAHVLLGDNKTNLLTFRCIKLDRRSRQFDTALIRTLVLYLSSLSNPYIPNLGSDWFLQGHSPQLSHSSFYFIYFHPTPWREEILIFGNYSELRVSQFCNKIFHSVESPDFFYLFIDDKDSAWDQFSLGYIHFE
jgi:hypothetical protein